MASPASASHAPGFQASFLAGHAPGVQSIGGTTIAVPPSVTTTRMSAMALLAALPRGSVQVAGSAAGAARTDSAPAPSEGAAEAGPRAPGAKPNKWRLKKRKLEQKKYTKVLRQERVVDQRQQAQALAYNRSGRARTRDNLMPVALFPTGPRKKGFGAQAVHRAVAKPRRGPGQYKVWTGEAICRAAFSPAEATCRTKDKPDGGSASHGWGCDMITADLIETLQRKGAKRRRKDSLATPLDFYITNNMFDETKLYVAAPGGHRAKKRRTLAQGCQITFKKPGAEVEDVDIIRPPALVRRCTAAACAGVMAQPTDPFGIAPDADEVPKAAFYGFLTATDSHSVNKLVAKWLAALVTERRRPTLPQLMQRKPLRPNAPSTAAVMMTQSPTWMIPLPPPPLMALVLPFPPPPLLAQVLSIPMHPLLALALQMARPPTITPFMQLYRHGVSSTRLAVCARSS